MDERIKFSEGLEVWSSSYTQQAREGDNQARVLSQGLVTSHRRVKVIFAGICVMGKERQKMRIHPGGSLWPCQTGWFC